MIQISEESLTLLGCVAIMMVLCVVVLMNIRVK